MQPGDLVRVYPIDTKLGRSASDDTDFTLGTLDGQASDSHHPPGTSALVVDVKHMPHLVRGEEIVILLIGGKMGWAYKEECDRDKSSCEE